MTADVWTAAGLRSRLESLRESAGFRAYQQVRDRVLQMVEAEAGRPPGVQTPSEYWSEELENFDYLLDASPLVVDKLRHHTYHVTGLRVYDYRSNNTATQRHFSRKLSALRKKDTAGLFVPEWPELGGFGFNIDGRLVNLDTLKFYEVLIALDHGAVLDEFRRTDERKIVWEIGAGWGGFPYQFKTICPNVTYVIADFPELFLYSGTYLTAAFPQARVRWFGDVPAERTFERWQDFDFILIPNTAAREVIRPPRLDLTINMVSFQEMTSAQVAEYAAIAHDAQCPFLYSLNRERSGYNTELEESVSQILERYYWLREIEILHVSYQKMLEDEPTPTDYRHLIGWRRQPA
jgi:hypothetical protein